jgi:hypothetical protein
MIDILDSGILNCSVTKTDVRNADAIFGPSIQRKDCKMFINNQPQHPHDSRHLLREEDSISARGVHPSRTVHLKNRGTEGVASGLASFLTTASSRGFD